MRRRKLNWKLYRAEAERLRKGLNGAAEGWTGDWINWMRGGRGWLRRG